MLQVKYSGGACSDTNIGYFIGFGTVFFFVCAVSAAQLVRNITLNSLYALVQFLFWVVLESLFDL